MQQQNNATNSLAHTKWTCKYHIVFAPKYRRKVFYEGKREAIRDIIRTLCKRKKKDRRIEAYTVLIFLNRQGCVLIQKRGGSVLLAGMWEFPMLAGHLSEAELSQFLEQSGIAFEKIERADAVKHVFTHMEWHMECGIVYVDSDFTTDISSDIALIRKVHRWCSMEELKRDHPVPTAFKKYVSKVEDKIGKTKTE